MKKMLLVFAHPNDEEFIACNTAAKYVKAGWFIDYFYATGSKERVLGTLSDFIYRAIEKVLPDVVITFDTSGINNDPEHIKVCYATTYAFQKYALWLNGLKNKFRLYSIHDERWLKRLELMITDIDEPKLYYACVPKSAVVRAVKNTQLPKESFGKPWRGVPDGQITTIIDEEFFLLRMQGSKECFVGKNDTIRDRL